MNSEFELKGFWWLPETPEKEVPGTLLFTPGEPLKLELMGALNKTDERVLTHEDFINPQIILGMSIQGKPITLQKCLQKNSVGGFYGVSTTQFIVHLAFVGVHFSCVDGVKFTGLSVNFYNLDEWFSKKAFDMQHLEKGSVVVTYEQPIPIKTVAGDFHIDFVSLGPISSFNPVTHVNISQKATVSIWSETEKHFEAFSPVLRHLQNFFTLAMTKPTFVTNVIGQTELAKEDDPAFYYPVEIYYSAIGWQKAATKVDWFQMLFTLPSIEERLEEILKIWIDKAGIIKPVYDLYFSAIYSATYPEFHFLSLAQAIETYHRQVYGGKYQPDDEFMGGLYKTLVTAIPGDLASDFKDSLKKGKLRYANEYSLRKRLQLLTEHLAEKVKINFLMDKKQRGVFADKVTDTRNYLTHYPPELKVKAATSGQELYDLNQKLRLILQVCLLEELGFSFEKISEIFKKSTEYGQYFS